MSVEQVTGKGGDAVTANVNLKLGVMPTEIRVRLRSAVADINGSVAEVLNGDTVQLPQKLQGQYRVVGRFR